MKIKLRYEHWTYKLSVCEAEEKQCEGTCPDVFTRHDQCYLHAIIMMNLLGWH